MAIWSKSASISKHIKYDWLDEFVDDFAEQIAEITETKEDAVEHITHLPELSDPEAFGALVATAQGALAQAPAAGVAS